jgi:iron complex transport system permease protein
MTSIAGPAPAGSSARSAGDRSGIARAAIVMLAILLVGALALSLASGPTGFMPGRAVEVLAGALIGASDAADRDTLVILDIRLPRAAFSLMVGAALAVAGCVMQSLFRNPLADPGLIGISSGAALAAVLMIVLGGPFAATLPEAMRPYALPVAAFAGALAVTTILYAIATRDGRTSIATMLLAGIAIGALAAAAIGLLIFMSDDRQLRDVTFWSLGSLGGATWEKAAVLFAFTGLPLLAFLRVARDLDAMLLGEAEALHLGVEVEGLKRLAIVAAAASVGAAVSFTGVIGFLGLVVPHILRLAIGPTHRALIPASALAGAILLTLADTACRIVVSPAELPIGVLTAFFGAPFFLWLLLRRRGLADL